MMFWVHLLQAIVTGTASNVTFGFIWVQVISNTYLSLKAKVSAYNWKSRAHAVVPLTRAIMMSLGPRTFACFRSLTTALATRSDFMSWAGSPRTPDICPVRFELTHSAEGSPLSQSNKGHKINPTGYIWFGPIPKPWNVLIIQATGTYMEKQEGIQVHQSTGTDRRRKMFLPRIFLDSGTKRRIKGH